MKRLERSRSQRILFGICGGFARYLGVDADLVRVVWIATLLFGGIGLVPYVAAIFLMPESSEEEAPGEERFAKNLGLVLITLAGIVFLRRLGFDSGWGFTFWGFRFLVPALFLAAGVLLVWPRTRAAVGISPDRQIERTVSDRVLAGVAGGIARAAGVDANLVRLAFVLASVVTSGLAVLLYLLLVVVLPEEPVRPRTPVAPAAPPPSTPESPAPSGPPPAPEPPAGSGPPAADQGPEPESR